MNDFELKIRYPHHLNLNDIDELGVFNAENIVAKFDEIKWRQQLIRQLQLAGANTSFIITDQYNEQSITITLDSFAQSQQLEFRLESNIPVMMTKKDVFGLVTRKIRNTISFKQLSLARVRDYLMLFLNREVNTLEEIYKDHLAKEIKPN